MNLPHLFAPPPAGYASRRDFLRRVGGGFGMVALAGLMQQEKLLAGAAPNPLAPDRAISLPKRNPSSGCS